MSLHIKSFLGALAFSFLLYSKSFGLNLFLLAVIIVVLLLAHSKRAVFPWHYALCYLFTAFMVFVDPSGFHLFVHFLSLCVFIGKSVLKKSSVYIASFTGLLNFLVSALVRYVEARDSAEPVKRNLSPTTVNYIKGVLLSSVLLVLFAFLYQNANPVFEELVQGIDLSFFSFQWAFFTLLGYLLFLNLLTPYAPREVLEYDLEKGNELVAPSMPFSGVAIKELEKERTLGTMVFGALNILLIFFLITDFMYLVQATSRSYSGYSDSVHQGVYALVLSFVTAIVLILYFFRGNLNFYERNSSLKKLCYGWIFLNLLLVASTCYKNWEYVSALGFTYKRIGVFIYLILTLVALVTAYLKVSQLKNFMYLFRMNTASLFALLIVATAVPWNRAITWYNLNQLEQPDIQYLLQLGDSTMPLLHSYSKKEGSYLILEQEEAIRDGYARYQKEQTGRTWQEITLYRLTKTEAQ